MISSVALQAGATAVALKLAPISWAALCILLLADSRRASHGWKAFLAGLATLCSLFGIYICRGGALATAQQSDFAATRWWAVICWALSAVLAAICLIQQCKLWMSTTPSQLHDEAQEGAQEGAHCEASTMKSPIGANRGNFLAVLGLGASLCGLFWGQQQLGRLDGWALWTASAQQLLAMFMLGIAVVCVVELTWLTTPDGLSTAGGRRVRWSALAVLALVMATLQLALCASIFVWSPGYVGQDFQEGVLGYLFAFTLLLVSYMVWMIPHRVAGFQAQGNARGWASLALAAWLAMLSLISVMALPADWPWRDLWG